MCVLCIRVHFYKSIAKQNNENKQEIFTVEITHISRLIHQLQNDVSRNNRMLNTFWVSLKVFVASEQVKHSNTHESWARLLIRNSINKCDLKKNSDTHP